MHMSFLICEKCGARIEEGDCSCRKGKGYTIKLKERMETWNAIERMGGRK